MKLHKSTLATLAATILLSCRLFSQPAVTVAPLPTLRPASTQPASTPGATPAAATSPLAISAMRAKAYPGSAIQIEQTLPPGAGYNRYVASYDSDGLRLYALLTVPTGLKPAGGWPVILLNHGYIPPKEYSTVDSYARVVDLMAQAGYIVFKPDYRGNGNSPGDATQIYISPDYMTDSLNALASIKKHPDANPDRIGVWGHSMGGNITLHELVISGDVRAAVLMAGVVGSYTEILHWWDDRVASGVLTTENDQQTAQLVQQLIQAHGTPQSNPGYWAPMDPTSYVGDIRAPVLIQVGTADTVVPPSFSENLAARMQQAGKDVRLHVYPGADHNLAPETAAVVQEAMAYFDQYLK